MGELILVRRHDISISENCKYELKEKWTFCTYAIRPNFGSVSYKGKRLYTIELQNFRICFGDMLTFISPYMEYFIAIFIVVANFSNPENFVILSK